MLSSRVRRQNISLFSTEIGWDDIDPIETLSMKEKTSPLKGEPNMKDWMLSSLGSEDVHWDEERLEISGVDLQV